MKQGLTILSFILSSISFGQKNRAYHGYMNVPELSLVTSVQPVNVIGTFKVDVGFEGLVLSLDKSKSFKEYAYSCDGKEPLDSGMWEIRGNTIVLDGPRQSRTFELVKYEGHSILVPLSMKEAFIKDFKAALNEVREEKELDKNLSAGRVINSLQLLIYSK